MINYEELRQAIRGMKPRQKMYIFLKSELLLLGHWKNIKRGKPDIRNTQGKRPDEKQF